ncbi:MFS general substrate transporter [Calocera cornea HHB12733]|uniref:MFS general substrate transporter n=1 Tax=Calocera cornea HHB12733 TaxID=1353952 RepID=A0A165D129_9BASI|nr:MFS general substrate transporter [Calocera cornea HHB12733]
MSVEKTSSTPEVDEKGSEVILEETSHEQAARFAPGTIVIDEVAEKKLVRKWDKILLPLLMIIYLLGYLDRTNMGNARLMGLTTDVLGGDPTGQRYAWINSAFYFAYIIFQYPGTIFGKYFPQNIWLGLAATGWGVCCTLQATSFNFAGLFVARFGVGVFESMFSPNMSLYFTFFYTRKEIGKRLGIWFACASIAGAFGGLIAYGVQHIKSSVQLWKLLFIIEGIPAVIFGLSSIYLLPDRPETTKYLTEEERALAIVRMNRGGQKEVEGTLNKAHVKAAFKDWKIYLYGAIYFGVNTAASALGAFLPTIIAQLGFTAAQAQLLTVPPYAAGAAILIATNFISDHFQSRGIPMVFASLWGGIGYLLLLVSTSVGVRYFATFLITSSTYTVIGLSIAWFPYNMGSESKRAAGIPVFQSIGQCGSICGSNIFPTADAPRYFKGFGLSCGFSFATALVAAAMTVFFRYENARRDREYGVIDRNAPVDTSDADDSKGFRYTV